MANASASRLEINFLIWIVENVERAVYSIGKDYSTSEAAAYLRKDGHASAQRQSGCHGIGLAR